MNILALSIAHIYNVKVTGGATKTLRDLCVKLGVRGHHIRILSPYVEGCNSFEIDVGVTAYPILKYQGKFPHPFDVSFTNHVELMSQTLPHIDWADVCYIHDAGYPYRNIFSPKPVVVSVRDLIYTESILGALNFEATYIVPNSEYTARCLNAAFCLSGYDLRESIEVIPSGTDFRIFSPIKRKNGLINSYINLAQIQFKHPILLHPHRADPRKGFNESLKLLQTLIKTEKYKHPTLLAPGSDSDGRSIEVSVPNSLKKNVILHDWVPHDLMPHYYSLGDITLCLGTYVEGFGSNASVESLCCGTPVIQTKIGPVKDQEQNSFRKLVEPKNEEEIFRSAHELLSNGISRVVRPPYPADFLSVEQMAFQYEEIFKKAYKQSIASTCYNREIKRNKTDSNKFVLAPWCSWFGDRIYHEFKEYFFESWPNQIFLELVRSGAVHSNDSILNSEPNGVVFRYLIKELFLLPTWAI